MIDVEQLSKRFADVIAVDRLSLQVKEGEVLGFLGPNGAGKSTTMKMLTGFLSPCEGRIAICGHDIEKQRLSAQKIIGYLPEGAPAYGDMRVKQFLDFIAAVRGFRGQEKKRKVAAALEQVSLQDVSGRTIETLSKGFKRRVGLAQAILHDPKVLILDEPTDGLDPNQKQHVRELIQNLSRDKIVIISTHILEEVSAVCTRAVIIAEGKLRSDGSPEQLLAQSRYHNAVNFHLTNPCGESIAKLATIAGIEDVEVSECGRRIVVLAQRGQFIYPQVDDFIRQQALCIDNISVERGRLDEVFQRVTQQQEQELKQ